MQAHAQRSLQRSDHNFLRCALWEHSSHDSEASLQASLQSIAYGKDKSKRRLSLDESVTLQGSSSFLLGCCSSSDNSLTVKMLPWDGDESATLEDLVLPRRRDDPDATDDSSRMHRSGDGIKVQDLGRSSKTAMHHTKGWIYDRPSESDSSGWSSEGPDPTKDATATVNEKIRVGEFGPTVPQTAATDVRIPLPPPSETHHTKARRKRVRFGEAHVREYRVVIDAPATCPSQGRLSEEAKNLNTFPLTLDWYHSPVEFVYPALALGYHSYFCNRPCRLVEDKERRLCQLHDVNQDELRLERSRSIATRVADLILESASWPLRKGATYPDAEHEESSTSHPWDPCAGRDTAPRNKRAASLTWQWERVSPKPRPPVHSPATTIPSAKDLSAVPGHRPRCGKPSLLAMLHGSGRSSALLDSLASLPAAPLDDSSSSEDGVMEWNDLEGEGSLCWTDLADQAYNDRIHHVEETQEELVFGGGNLSLFPLWNQTKAPERHRRRPQRAGVSESRKPVRPVASFVPAHTPHTEFPHSLNRRHDSPEPSTMPNWVHVERTDGRELCPADGNRSLTKLLASLELEQISSSSSSSSMWMDSLAHCESQGSLRSDSEPSQWRGSRRLGAIRTRGPRHDDDDMLAVLLRHASPAAQQRVLLLQTPPSSKVVLQESTTTATTQTCLTSHHWHEDDEHEDEHGSWVLHRGLSPASSADRVATEDYTTDRRDQKSDGAPTWTDPQTHATILSQSLFLPELQQDSMAAEEAAPQTPTQEQQEAYQHTQPLRNVQGPTPHSPGPKPRLRRHGSNIMTMHMEGPTELPMDASTDSPPRGGTIPTVNVIPNRKRRPRRHGSNVMTMMANQQDHSEWGSVTSAPNGTPCRRMQTTTLADGTEDVGDSKRREPCTREGNDEPATLERTVDGRFVADTDHALAVREVDHTERSTAMLEPSATSGGEVLDRGEEEGNIFLYLEEQQKNREQTQASQRPALEQKEPIKIPRPVFCPPKIAEKQGHPHGKRNIRTDAKVAEHPATESAILKRVRFGNAQVRTHGLAVDCPRGLVSSSKTKLIGTSKRHFVECPLTLDWAYSSHTIVCSALELGYTSYFSNTQLKPLSVGERRLRIASVNGWSWEELRLAEARALCQQAIEFIRESSKWKLLPHKHWLYQDYSLTRMPFDDRWSDVNDFVDVPPVDKSLHRETMASEVMEWKRVVIDSNRESVMQDLPYDSDEAIDAEIQDLVRLFKLNQESVANLDFNRSEWLVNYFDESEEARTDKDLPAVEPLYWHALLDDQTNEVDRKPGEILSKQPTLLGSLDQLYWRNQGGRAAIAKDKIFRRQYGGVKQTSDTAQACDSPEAMAPFEIVPFANMDGLQLTEGRGMPDRRESTHYSPDLETGTHVRVRRNDQDQPMNRRTRRRHVGPLDL